MSLLSKDYWDFKGFLLFNLSIFKFYISVFMS